MPRKHKDAEWNLPEGESGRILTWDHVKISILMDIRDEMKNLSREMRAMNSILHCPHFIRVPRKLDDIRRMLKDKKSTRHERKTKTPH